MSVSTPITPIDVALALGVALGVGITTAVWIWYLRAASRYAHVVRFEEVASGRASKRYIKWPIHAFLASESYQYRLSNVENDPYVEMLRLEVRRRHRWFGLSGFSIGVLPVVFLLIVVLAAGLPTRSL